MGQDGPVTYTAIVLAGGTSRRFAGAGASLNKLTLAREGRTLLAGVIDGLHETLTLADPADVARACAQINAIFWEQFRSGGDGVVLKICLVNPKLNPAPEVPP